MRTCPLLLNTLSFSGKIIVTNESGIPICRIKIRKSGQQDNNPVYRSQWSRKIDKGVRCYH
jgi:hypothetical protein